MAEKPGQERTESATPRRRGKAREEGNVARSMEVGSVLVLGASLVGLAALGPAMTAKAGGLLTWQFSQLGSVDITPATIVGHVHRIAGVMAAIILPFAALIAVAGVGANVTQTGILLSFKPLSPQFNRISPAQGAKKIFSKRGAVELLKSLVKMAIVAGIVAWAMAGTIDELLPLMTVGLSNAYRVILVTMLKMAAAGAFALALVAILDFFFQRYDYEKQLMMTKQEIREEHKETEGDPQIKGKIRSAQLALSRQRMMEEVKTADVVVTNPIRFAVAVKYDGEKSTAPRVVAKGARLVAKRIRDIARESGVPVVENPPLARALFKACRVGAQIPLSMYQAVAELLAFVYRKRETAPGGLR